MSHPRPVESVEELYGTWKLVSWTRRLLDTGEEVEAFGKAPRGFLHYGRDGRVFWVMTKENRDGKAATHNVEVAWNEVWTGTAQIRNLAFEGSRLVMSTNPQAGVDGKRSASIFVWERPG